MSRPQKRGADKAQIVKYTKGDRQQSSDDGAKFIRLLEAELSNLAPANRVACLALRLGEHRAR